METSIKLDMDENGKNIDIIKYWSMIGSLLYLTVSRPDIMFCICLCAHFRSCPMESHVSAVKMIFLMFVWYNWFKIVVSKRKRVEFN